MSQTVKHGKTLFLEPRKSQTIQDTNIKLGKIHYDDHISVWYKFDQRSLRGSAATTT